MTRAFILLLSLLALLPTAVAPHFYRNSGGGCSQADGALFDEGAGTPGPVGATVLLLHNAYADATTVLPVTTIQAGEAVTWKWASLHCHSIVGGLPTVKTGSFYSGYHWPAQAGDVQALPGFFEYPIPSLEPELSYTHTFDAPGTFTYYCEHHFELGMVGVVVVS